MEIKYSHLYCNNPILHSPETSSKLHHQTSTVNANHAKLLQKSRAS